MQLPAIKVPFLAPAQIESAARELLARYSRWKEEELEPPIDVDEIVEGYLELDFEVTDLKESLGITDVLGATWFNDGRVCIDSSLEGNDGRFAFTVAHEIGHWQLHRPIIEMEKVTLPLFAGKPGEEPKPALVCRTQTKKQPAEYQADQFAARILMPAGAVRKAAKAVCGDNIPAWEGLDDSRKAGMLDSRLRALADQVKDQGGFTNASNQAMCYRLLDLKLVEDAKDVAGRLF
jgi:Zn-dependent peptidase ImmA (M78 family)